MFLLCSPMMKKFIILNGLIYHIHFSLYLICCCKILLFQYYVQMHVKLCEAIQTFIYFTFFFLFAWLHFVICSISHLPYFSILLNQNTELIMQGTLGFLSAICHGEL